MTYFPIMLSGYGSENYAKIVGPIYTNIPLAMIEPREDRAKRNYSQTLAQLAKRGGLTACEAVAVLEDREYRTMTLQAACTRLAELVSIWETARMKDGER